MCNIELNYLYRDYTNYKNHDCVVFSNAENIPLQEIKETIENKLIEGEWFYAREWKLPDLHFEKWDAEIDHNYHEFGFVKHTADKPSDERDIKIFLSQI